MFRPISCIKSAAEDNKLILTTDCLVTPDYLVMIPSIVNMYPTCKLIDNQVLLVNSFHAHVLFTRCKLLSSDMETMILQMFVRISIRVLLHAIGSQRTRRIYRLITENIEIDHSSERVVLHLYSC